MSDPHLWPPSPHLDAWAMRVRLLAACARGEAKQGWIPCRVVRRIVGGQRSPKHRHDYRRVGYGGAGWSLYRCACGAEEIDA